MSELTKLHDDSINVFFSFKLRQAVSLSFYLFYYYRLWNSSYTPLGLTTLLGYMLPHPIFCMWLGFFLYIILEIFFLVHCVAWPTLCSYLSVRIIILFSESMCSNIIGITCNSDHILFVFFHLFHLIPCLLGSGSQIYLQKTNQPLLSFF